MQGLTRMQKLRELFSAKVLDMYGTYECSLRRTHTDAYASEGWPVVWLLKFAFHSDSQDHAHNTSAPDCGFECRAQIISVADAFLRSGRPQTNFTHAAFLQEHGWAADLLPTAVQRRS